MTAEKSILGFDHAEIAFDICEKWQIPKHLSLSIKFHHNPSISNDNGLAYILNVADSIAFMINWKKEINDTTYDMNTDAVKFLKLQITDIQEISKKVQDYLEKTTQPNN